MGHSGNGLWLKGSKRRAAKRTKTEKKTPKNDRRMKIEERE